MKEAEALLKMLSRASGLTDEEVKELEKKLSKDKICITEQMLIKASAKASSNNEVIRDAFGGIMMLVVPILVSDMWKILKEEADGTEKD